MQEQHLKLRFRRTEEVARRMVKVKEKVQKRNRLKIYTKLHHHQQEHGWLVVRYIEEKKERRVAQPPFSIIDVATGLKLL